MPQDASLIELAGLLLLVVGLFLVSGLHDVTHFRYHVGRIAASRVPYPAAAFWTGMTVKFAGCALLLTGWHAALGVYLLMGFIVAASAIYLRFWEMEDPLRKNLCRMLFLSNVGILGGLLLLRATL